MHSLMYILFLPIIEKNLEEVYHFGLGYLVTNNFSIMKKYSFEVIVNNVVYYPKGFYYQGKFVVIVGCEKTGHTIRQKFLLKDTEIKVMEYYVQ